MAFSVLFIMGLGVFFGLHEWLDDYIKFVNVTSMVLIPLVVAGAAGSPVKRLIENQRTKHENGK